MKFPSIFNRFLTTYPLAALDVGAQGGIPAHWQMFLPFMTVDALEPIEEACRKQQASAPTNVHWYPIGLADTTGMKTFFILNRSSGSSLYPPNEKWMSIYGVPSYFGIRAVIDIPCTSLTDFVKEYHRPIPELIKLDTQGSELPILTSLEEHAWNVVLAVEIEVEFLELYKGQPRFEEVHRFMEARGFQLFDLRTHRMYRSKGEEGAYYLTHQLQFAFGTPRVSAQLVAGDALYMRQPDDERVWKDQTQWLKYFMVTILYCYFDVSLYLLDEAEKRFFLSPDDVRELRSYIHAIAPRPRFFERTDIVGRITRKLLRYFHRHPGVYRVFWIERGWPDQ